jgi:ketosteroid isomerase-like protein
MTTDLEAFAKDWIEAFNSKNLDHILSHYTEDVELYSPRVKLVMGDPSGKVKGKKALRDYFSTALARSPDLRFTLEKIYPGAGSVVFQLRTNEGRDGAESMVFGEGGLVREVRAHWVAA